MLPSTSLLSPQPLLEPESGVKDISREFQRKEDYNAITGKLGQDLVTNRYIHSKGDGARYADQPVICCMLCKE